MESRKPTVDEILKKYGAKIEGQIKSSSNAPAEYSQSYKNLNKSFLKNIRVMKNGVIPLETLLN